MLCHIILHYAKACKLMNVNINVSFSLSFFDWHVLYSKQRKLSSLNRLLEYKTTQAGESE